MPITTAEKVQALSRDFGSQRRLAELLGVSPAQVTRWRRGQGIDELNAERVDLLELVMSNLLRVYPVAAAERWLTGLNPALGDRRPRRPGPLRLPLRGRAGGLRRGRDARAVPGHRRPAAGAAHPDGAAAR